MLRATGENLLEQKDVLQLEPALLLGAVRVSSSLVLYAHPFLATRTYLSIENMCEMRQVLNSEELREKPASPRTNIFHNVCRLLTLGPSSVSLLSLGAWPWLSQASASTAPPQSWRSDA